MQLKVRRAELAFRGASRGPASRTPLLGPERGQQLLLFDPTTKKKKRASRALPPHAPALAAAAACCATLLLHDAAAVLRQVKQGPCNSKRGFQSVLGMQ